MCDGLKQLSFPFNLFEDAPDGVSFIQNFLKNDYTQQYSDVIIGAMTSHDCLLNRLVRRRSKKTSKLLVTGLCVGNSPVTGEFPAQMANNAENVSIWWRHHE